MNGERLVQKPVQNLKPAYGITTKKGRKLLRFRPLYFFMVFVIPWSFWFIYCALPGFTVHRLPFTVHASGFLPFTTRKVPGSAGRRMKGTIHDSRAENKSLTYVLRAVIIPLARRGRRSLKRRFSCTLTELYRQESKREKQLSDRIWRV